MFDEPKQKSIFFVPVAESCQSTTWEPQADIYKVEEGWLVKFDLAGVRMQDIEVSLKGRRLKVQGVRRDWLVEETRSCYSLEITYSRFSRSLQLPDMPLESKISLDYQDGLLLVWIKRTQ